MAILVFRATNNTSGHSLAWKRGMPVEVLPNNHVFSPRELLPPAQGGSFVRVTVSDVTVQQVRDFLRTRWSFELEEVDYDQSVVTVEPELIPIRRRKFHLRVDDLPVNVRNQLRTTGAFTTTWPNIRTFLQNLRTLENF